MVTAKIFWSGRSQAVRLPKEFRFAADIVRVRRRGNAVILEPIASDWKWLDMVAGNVVAGKLDDDFVDAVEEVPSEQQRPDLDRLFE